MIHIINRLIIVLLMTLVTVTAAAYDFMVDGLCYNINSDGKSVSVTYERDGNYYPSSYISLSGDVTIPSNVTCDGKTYSVTSIGENAFEHCIGITSVTIPNSVTSIGTASFFCCSGMKSVIIPNSVTIIGNLSFASCTSLTSVTIPSSVTTIVSGAFWDCSGLTSVTIPSSVTDVDAYAFRDCTSLTSVVWNVKNIWGYTSSSFAPFNGSTNLKTFTFGDEVENIPVCLCSGLSSLTSITIGNSVKTIGHRAFADCSGLTSVTIPNSVTTINGGAFDGCSGLTSVSIGNSVAKIDNNSFANCSSLESITVHKAFPIAMDENNFDAEVYDSAVLYVPTGRTIFFQDDNVWGKFSNINEKDMPDVEVSSNPFDNLCSQRMVIGYTDSEFQGSIGWDKVDNVVQAIKFPVDRMQRIKGNKITHIRFSMWDTYTAASNMKVWIGSSRDNRDLAVKEVTDMHKGWNVIALDDPYIITGDSIIVGVEYKHDASKISYPVVWDPYSEGSCLYYREGKWNNEDGTFSIQCVVEGECLPKNDIKIVDFAGPLYKRAIKAGEDYDCTMTVRNWGSMPITSLSFLSKLAGEEVESGLKYSINMARGAGNYTISYRIKPGNGVSVGNHQLTIVPKTINGQDFTYSDDPIVTNMKIYEHDMGRQKVLVQVYSGTWCGYCPGFDEVVEKKRAECDYLSLISIHSRDFYTNAVCDNYLNMLYTSGIPNVDLNRCIEHTLKNYREYTMNYCLDDAKAQPAFANVNIAGKYEKNSSTATFSISGEKNEDFIPIEEWTNLTVLLVEDNVLGGQYGTDLYPYPHHGIIRANLSAIWGDLVQWDGDHYQKSYTINLDDAWNFDNLRVVAFLSKPYTDRNYDEINVVNCEEMFLKDIFSGIDDVVVDPNADAPNDVYDMYGRRVRTNTTSLEGLPIGIYIVGGKKVLKK